MSLDYRNCDPVACPRDWVSADSGWRSGRESLACDAAACSAAHIALLRWFPRIRCRGCPVAQLPARVIRDSERTRGRRTDLRVAASSCCLGRAATDPVLLSTTSNPLNAECTPQLTRYAAANDSKSAHSQIGRVGEPNRRERSAHNDELCFEDRGRSADHLRSADSALPRKQGL